MILRTYIRDWHIKLIILLGVLQLSTLNSQLSTLKAQGITIGTYTFPDGAVYQGELFRGKPYGTGMTTFRNGDTHQGKYVKGKREGYGVYLFTDGEKYEGDWLQDHQDRKSVV